MINNTAFSNITSNSAYWVGFLMADGCITDKNKIQLQLNAKDYWHINKFKVFINSDCQIYEFNNPHPHAGISIRSKQLVDDLSQFGVEPRKSFTTKVNKLETNIDFWRGLVDGDGWIQKKVSNSSCRLGLTGSYDICQQFLNFAKNILVGYKIKVRIVKNNSIYAIRFNGKQAVKLLTVLYKDADTYLDRKYLLANELTNNFEEN